MYEKRLIELGSKFKEDITEFYIIKNKEREIYFKRNELSIKFIKQKFESSFFKRIIYFLIKNNLIKLQRIYLSKIFGDVIFASNNIKCFNLSTKKLICFPNEEGERTLNFIRTTKIREKYLKEYSPTISKIDYKFPYFEEELLEKYTGDLNLPISRLIIMNENTKLIHGDMIKEHILKKGDSCVFIDWENVKKGDIKEDLIRLR